METHSNPSPAKVTTTEYFGGCPTCGKSSGYVNIRSSHYGTCDEHRVYWPIGAGLFSSWLDEDEAEWQRNRDLLASYEEVKAVAAENVPDCTCSGPDDVCDFDVTTLPERRGHPREWSTWD